MFGNLLIVFFFAEALCLLQRWLDADSLLTLDSFYLTVVWLTGVEKALDLFALDAVVSLVGVEEDEMPLLPLDGIMASPPVL